VRASKHNQQKEKVSLFSSDESWFYLNLPQFGFELNYSLLLDDMSSFCLAISLIENLKGATND